MNSELSLLFVELWISVEVSICVRHCELTRLDALECRKGVWVYER